MCERCVTAGCRQLGGAGGSATGEDCQHGGAGAGGGGGGRGESRGKLPGNLRPVRALHRGHHLLRPRHNIPLDTGTDVPYYSEHMTSIKCAAVPELAVGPDWLPEAGATGQTAASHAGHRQSGPHPRRLHRRSHPPPLSGE